MPRPERIFELCQLLAGRGITIGEIARRFGVSPRTAYRDLALLEQRHGAPVLLEDGRYRLMETATMRPVALTGEEARLLRLALENAALRSRRPFAARLRAIEAKLAAAMRNGDPVDPPLALVPLDRTGPSADAVLPALERAIAERRVCEADYESLSGGAKHRRRLHPLKIFQRANSWYLAAFSPEHGDVRTFRLDRFDAVRPTDERFTPPAEFDLDRFLADAWEIFRGDGELAAHLRFDPSLAPLFFRARHHEGERVERAPDGTIDYHVKVSHADELARWIVGFGGLATVVAPVELRDRVRGIAIGSAECNRPGTNQRKPSGGRDDRRRCRLQGSDIKQ